MDKQTKEIIINDEKQLEQEAELISEAISDIILICRLNLDDKTAFNLIKKQFLVIDRQRFRIIWIK